MPKAVRLALASLLIVAVTAASCSKPTDTPRNYSDGSVAFVNSGAYLVRLTDLAHSRGAAHSVVDLDRVVSIGGRFQLPNLLDGGSIFRGGDGINLAYQSLAVDEFGNPLFVKTLAFLVNGSVVIRVKGQGGEYEIGGN